jgi:hypothetical protein
VCFAAIAAQDRVISGEAAARIVVLVASGQHFLIPLSSECMGLKRRAAAFLAPNQWRFAAAGTVIRAPPFPAKWNSNEIVALVPFAAWQRKYG